MLKQVSRRRLSESVCHYFGLGFIRHYHVAAWNIVENQLILDIDMLSAIVDHVFLGDRNTTLIILLDTDLE